ATGRRLRIGVPFSFSMHAELLSYWLSSVGLSAIQGIDIRTVPPPLMAEAVRACEVDAFCVGEPWGTLAVENGLGELLLPTSAIWSFAPEKVLAVRKGWAADAPRRAEAMVRAIWRAGRWLAKPTNRLLAAEILSRPAYLDLPAEMIERALTGKLVISPRGEERRVDTFVEFYRNAAMFPWHSQARWISHRLAARAGIGEAEAMEKGKQVFRTDIFRAALAGTGADLPAKSSRPEGANPASGVFTGESGKPIPPPNVFFDCRVFDPDAK
ncbi:MAG TPA: nitrate transporter, partial [Rhodobacterales bacterium]|nr:nitrate transporter [Rhodobacterales bacterium]